MLYKIDIKNKNDKLLVEQIIDLFLNDSSYEEIEQKTNQNIDFIKWILKYKKMIITNFGEDIWKSIQIKIKEISVREKEAEKMAQYEHTMDNVIYYMLNSLYNYDEMVEKVFVNKKNFQDMVSNFDYIESRYGSNILKRLKEAIEIRKVIPRSHKDDVILVKDPKYRRIVFPNVITVSSYQYSLIEKVYLFFEYHGNTQKMAMNSEYCLNTIVASLNDICLKDILLEPVYKKLQTLLEIDSILTQNRLTERNVLVKNVVSIVYSVNGDAESIIEILGYPIEIVKRILDDPYTSIICQNLGIDKTCIEIKENDNLIDLQKKK